MPLDLKELKQARMVEAKRHHRRSASSEIEIDPDAMRGLRTSQISMVDSSPITPTFSLSGHSRFPSSSSSLAGSPSMGSSFEGFAAAKRPLTEVKEDPQERDGEFKHVNAPISESQELDRFPSIPSATSFTEALDGDEQADYEWIDNQYSDEHFDLGASKRRRADNSPAPSDNATARMGSGIRSLSQKWKSRKDKRISSLPDSFHESINGSRSRANSVRAPSVIGVRESMDYPDGRIPLTLSPAESFIEDSHSPAPAQSPLSIHSPMSIDTPSGTEGLSSGIEEEEEAAKEASRTPLLPPVMASLQRDSSPVQSPLQSPKIAGSPTVAHESFDSQGPSSGLITPPLSTKPSISSFHHRPIVPPSDIPPITLAEPRDRWARWLGHANFTIFPEPYQVPLPADIDTCARLRADWEEARSNYAKHLAQTREHYTAKSRVFDLTEQKWAEVDQTWRSHYETAFNSIPPTSSSLNLVRQSQSPTNMETSIHSIQHLAPEVAVKLPSIDGAQIEGKFPRIGDVGIVGPMQVLKPVDQREQKTPAKKRAFWKFFQGMLPASVAFGRSNA